jgi:hypothetical protein
VGFGCCHPRARPRAHSGTASAAAPRFPPRTPIKKKPIKKKK